MTSHCRREKLVSPLLSDQKARTAGLLGHLTANERKATDHIITAGLFAISDRIIMYLNI